VRCLDQSTSVDPKVVDVLNPEHISCLGVPLLAALLSEAALRDSFLKGRLRELVSTVDSSKNQCQKPTATTVPGSSFSEYMAGASPALSFVFDTIRRYAISRAPVLIAGESGAARELAARAIHYGSASKNGPFVSISCAPKPVAGIGPELFGYEKSVSARGVRKIGRIEVAAGGTIFLDAIDNLPLEAQARLLRFLQEGTIESIGGRKPISVATRVIVATRFDLRKAVANRQFRGDLFDRLDGLTLNLPPLQEQGHDILLMAIFFLQQFAAKTGHEKLDISRGTERCIPGSPLGLASLTQQDATPISQDLAGTRANVEAALIRATLKRNRNNIKQSAKEMGISRVTLYRAIHKYGITVDRLRPHAVASDVMSACHPHPLSPLIPFAHPER
jgi:two-component system, NtrC family, response regulator HydG